jgi:hypothetical protein
MTIRTENQVAYSEVLLKNLHYGSKILANFILAPLARVLPLGKFRRAAWMVEQYDRNRKNLRLGRLPDTTVAAFTQSNNKRVDGTTARKLRHQAVDDEKLSDPRRYGMVQMGALLLRSILEQNAEKLRSAVNIGARIDPTFSYMAQRFPSMSFTSIDMQDTLGETNTGLAKPANWKFVNGYALAMLEDTDFRADLVYMTSTSPKFNAAEMRRYLAALKSRGVKILVFNEPWWIFPLGFDALTLPLPETVDPDGARLGGFLADYHHNYPVLLEQAGYVPVLMRMMSGGVSSGGGYHHLQVVAVDKDAVGEFRFDLSGV